MKLVTFSGPPSSGKTSVILKMAAMLGRAHSFGVVKFDCLASHDGELYEQAGIPVQTGISGALCPDHFFASNIGACMQWASRVGLDVLISESAGLCNRCSPHLRNAAAVCVIDILSGIDAPFKIGPMLKLADFVAITKSDLVSQAEREVFALHVIRANPRARVLFVNGLTGQGAFALCQALCEVLKDQGGSACRLRFSMPSAVCSYCFGETQIGDKYATGNIKYMKFSDEASTSAVPPTLAARLDARTAQGAKEPIACSTPVGACVLDMPFERLVAEHPVCVDFFGEVGIPQPRPHESIRDLIESFDEFDLSDCGMDASTIAESFTSYLARVEALAHAGARPIRELRLVGGSDKAGSREDFELTVHAGEMICIVGPTGSGKSRLLEDVEYLAQGDTPTGRHVLVDGHAPQPATRHAVESKIVAQLSQGMAFVMDLPACEFLRLHAESRMMGSDAIERTVQDAIACANELCGEPFAPDTSLTMLSGGQSRALMIADLAFVSTSPVVLIDEIENAGVDRRRALGLLVDNDKIVFAVTHDPLIALLGDKRLIIGNGGVRNVIVPSEAERRNARTLQAVDRRLMELRQKVRAGERIDFDVGGYLEL